MLDLIGGAGERPPSPNDPVAPEPDAPREPRWSLAELADSTDDELMAVYCDLREADYDNDPDIPILRIELRRRGLMKGVALAGLVKSQPISNVVPFLPRT